MEVTVYSFARLYSDLVVQHSLLFRKTNAMKSVHKTRVFHNLKRRDGPGNMRVAVSVDWF